MASTLLEGSDWPVIGMVHLKPLPGTAGYGGSIAAVLDAALADAEALTAGGIDAIMIENYGDVPFRKGAVEPHTVALVAMIAAEVRRCTPRPLGINMLRNDPLGALAVALACGAALIRVNVHTGAMLTDQGVIEGAAAATLEYRRKIGAGARVAADVHVKHAAPLADLPLEVVAADAVERGLADALIVTGTRTGGACDVGELHRVRSAVRVPVLVGSGVTAESVGTIVNEADGAIVGSWLKRDGDVHAPVDPDRVARLMDAVRTARG